MTATFACNLPIAITPLIAKIANPWPSGALDLEPERRPVALHASSCRRGIVGADNQDRLVGPFGEQLRPGGRRGLGVAVEARRPAGVRQLAGMVGHVAGDHRALPL